MKNSNDTIGNRFRDLPLCSALPQPLSHHVPHIGECRLYLLGLRTRLLPDLTLIHILLTLQALDSTAQIAKHFDSVVCPK
jgi:hypothetical protein